jgi:hypothetical protein
VKALYGVHSDGSCRACGEKDCFHIYPGVEVSAAGETHEFAPPLDYRHRNASCIVCGELRSAHPTPQPAAKPEGEEVELKPGELERAIETAETWIRAGARGYDYRTEYAAARALLALKAENAEMRARDHAQALANDETKKQVASLLDRVEAAETENALLTAERDEWRRAAVEASDDYSHAEAEVEALTSENARLTAANKAIVEINGDLGEEVRRLTSSRGNGVLVPGPELEAMREEIAMLRAACRKLNEDVSQTLGKVLGFPWFKDDQQNFPGATEADGVCVGDEVAESLAARAADKIAKLKAERDEAERRLTQTAKAADMERLAHSLSEQGLQSRLSTLTTENERLLEACESAEAGISDWRLGRETPDHDDMRNLTAAEPYLFAVRSKLRAALALSESRKS